MRNLAGLVAGIIFGFGLATSDMLNPVKVQNFLDIAGTWDPSLAFVMGGAVLVTLIGFRIILRRPKPRYDSRFYLPTRQDRSVDLLGGSALFGIGWGLTGYCPGPAIAVVFIMPGESLVFVGSMVLGSYLAGLWQQKSRQDDFSTTEVCG